MINEDCVAKKENSMRKGILMPPKRRHNAREIEERFRISIIINHKNAQKMLPINSLNCVCRIPSLYTKKHRCSPGQKKAMQS
jgi:hypothetical protein